MRALCLVLYAAVVVAAPLHHDSACNFRTPQHCAVCAASQLGASPGAVLMPGHWLLADAGSAAADALVPAGFLLSIRHTGRSPPFAF